MRFLGVFVEMGDGWMCVRYEQDMRSACEELRPGFDDNDDEPEVVEIWRMRQVAHSYGGAENSTKRPGKNSRRPWIGDRGGSTGFDYDAVMVLSEVIVNDRRYRVSRAA